MAATIIVEDGSQVAGANSYVSLAAANTFFQAHPQSALWDACSDDLKNRLLIFAARILDGNVDFAGFKTNPGQSMQWPRVLARDKNQYGGAYWRRPDTYLAQYFDPVKVPKPVQDAQCELARFLADTSEDRTGDHPGKGLSEFEINGAFKIKFDHRDSRSPIPDFVIAILQDVGTVRGLNVSSARITRS